MGVNHAGILSFTRPRVPGGDGRLSSVYGLITRDLLDRCSIKKVSRTDEEMAVYLGKGGPFQSTQRAQSFWLMRFGFLAGIWISLGSTGFGQELTQEVVVEAPREGDTELRSPGSRVELEEEALEKQTFFSIADALEREGLPFQSFGGPVGLGTPVLRGFAENASSRSLVLVDGLSVSRPDLAGTPLIGAEFGAYQRVSLERGSRSVRYGSGALAGVIFLQSQSPHDGPRNEITLAGGSSGYEEGNLRMTQEVGDWAVSLEGGQKSSQGWRENAAFSVRNWSLGVASPEEEAWTGTWRFQQSDLATENPGGLTLRQFQEDPRQAGATALKGIEDRVKIRRFLQDLEFEVGSGGTLQWRSSWQGTRGSYRSFGVTNEREQKLEQWRGELLWEVSLDEGLSWQVGLRGSLDDLQNINFGVGDGRHGAVLGERVKTGTARLERQSYGVFLTGRREWEQGWGLTIGGSWDRWSLEALVDRPVFIDAKRGGNGAAAELVLDWDCQTGVNFWLRYDAFTRFPVLDEIVAYQNFPLPVPFNVELQNESGQAIELGWEVERGGLSWTGALYGQWIEGEIAFDADFEVNLNVNLADSWRGGAESRFAYEGKGWSADLSYGLCYARYRSGRFRGREAALVPRHVFTLGGEVDLRDDLSFSLGAVAESARKPGNYLQVPGRVAELPGSLRWHAGLTWEPREGLSVRVKGRNLTNHHYQSVNYGGLAYPAEGRQLLTELRYEF